jgi:DNA repair exonuclease SbcCD ATPase subunit
MAEKGERQSYDMGLGDFDRYLRDKNKELDGCIVEIEEIQKRLQDEFQRELTVWQGLFGYCYPQVTVRRAELPPDLTQYLDRIEQEELERLKAEIADLTAKLAAGRKAIDDWTGSAQEAARSLRAANPDLNAREEQLKRKVTALQDEYTVAYEDLERAHGPFLGWLTNAGAIRKARRRQAETKKEQAQAIEQLRQVRQNWLTAVQETSETQSKLREQWQQATIETAEQQARYDYVRNNLDALARQNGVQRALDEMTEAPAMTDELGDKLRELAAHNAVRARFEDGLMAVSESLGMLRGVNKGLDKFGESVSQVLGEQKRYSLKEVTIPVSREVAAVNQTWAALAKEARDEEQAVREPLEFAKIARQYVIDRLTPQVIQAFFESMGDALNKGTSAWT